MLQAVIVVVVVRHGLEATFCLSPGLLFEICQQRQIFQYTAALFSD
jgi:hypothetical protein